MKSISKAEQIIGRVEEVQILQEVLDSGEAELVVIYGRRRVGKTFLVRNFFHKTLQFEFTGAHEATLDMQLENFSFTLKKMSGSKLNLAKPKNWLEAFIQLESYLEEKIKEPGVLFFDEFPWIHTPKSKFLQAFAHWWNTWASRQKQLKIVICGSAASWMITNVLNNRGGLHNRVTRKIKLLPFTLGETQQFLVSRGVRLDNYQVLQLYMSMGGVPQYLKQVKKGESAMQSIDRLFFSKNGLLKTEFVSLYQSLFADAGHHEAIVRALAKKGEGLSRPELIKICGFTTGGGTTRLFKELEESGFIAQYIPFGRAERDSIYKLSDEYSLFYMKFIENARSADSESWMKIALGQSYTSWSGYAFEAVCQKHIKQIKKALGISGVYTEASAWRYISNSKAMGTQIDLLLDRQDHCINICEMKFLNTEFVIKKKYAAELDEKVSVFRDQTRTRKALFPTLITTHGTRKNEYYTGRVQAELVSRQLFED